MVKFLHQTIATFIYRQHFISFTITPWLLASLIFWTAVSTYTVLRGLHGKYVAETVLWRNEQAAKDVFMLYLKKQMFLCAFNVVQFLIFWRLLVVWYKINIVKKIVVCFVAVFGYTFALVYFISSIASCILLYLENFYL